LSDDRNPYAPPKADVADPAPPVLPGLASRGLRLTAAIVDGILSLVVTVPLMIYTGYFEGIRSGGDGPSYEMAVGVSALAFAAFVAMHGYWLVKHGQTIGKRIVGIRIVNVSDGRVPKVATLLGTRYGLMWLVSLVPGIGTFVALVDDLFIFRSDRRCLHDLIAGTKVVAI
jgi:uncharacterized RDD family membrane protein YckC